MNRSTIEVGEGGGFVDSVPGNINRKALPGDRTKWWASLLRFELLSQRGWSNMSPGGSIFVPSPPQNGKDFPTSPHPPFVE